MKWKIHDNFCRIVLTFSLIKWVTDQLERKFFDPDKTDTFPQFYFEKKFWKCIEKNLKFKKNSKKIPYDQRTNKNLSRLSNLLEG